jgi:PncC family amidohydrolase
MSIEQKIAKILTKSKETVALAESCSGGLLANRLTNIPGSSTFFKGGIITYSNKAKISLLKVPSFTIKKHGAVSSQTACSMAKNVRSLFKVNFGLAITGIAGPSGGTKLKPVGLTFIAINTPRETACFKFHFKGNRLQNKKSSTDEALKLLLEFIEKET